MVAIAVRDDGPGIDAARLQRVFELSLHHRRPAPGSASRDGEAGWSSVRAATIDAASTAGEGATFTIRPPAVGAALHAQPAFAREA